MGLLFEKPINQSNSESVIIGNNAQKLTIKILRRKKLHQVSTKLTTKTNKNKIKQ